MTDEEYLAMIHADIAMIDQFDADGMHEASWAFLEQYRRDVPAHIFNRCKAGLAAAMLKYNETVAKKGKT